MNAAIWWIRRDLRLQDNQALAAARESSSAVLPVFISDPILHASPYFSPRRWQFLLGGLHTLDRDLRRLGSQLHYFQGKPLSILRSLVGDGYASRIFAEEDITPYAQSRDQQIQAVLPIQFTPGLSLLPPGTITTQTGKPLRIFTPFRNAFISHPLSHGLAPQSAAASMPLPERTPESLSLPPHIPNACARFSPGEREAQMRLRAFSAGENAPIFDYQEGRNGLAQPGSASLSPYLRLGMLSIRSAYKAAEQAIERTDHLEARKSAEIWRDQLLWRDFFINILAFNPAARKMSFRPEFRRIVWLNREDEFTAWKEGRTGYPLVDAAMRQLHEEGWIPNRARMVVASFLVKHLLIDWRWGERWFMQQLLDGDPAQNNGGWQWSAGTGTDAAPYFRIFNPILQSRRYDPEGDYIRRWVPELARTAPRLIHKPWHLSDEERHGYPLPLVDHRYARERALEAYAQARRLRSD